MYGLTGTYIPAFFMAGGFTTIGVCLLFLVPILLPAEIAQQWNKRSMRQEIKLPSDVSETTKTWSLSSGESNDKCVSPVSAPLSAFQDKDTVPHILIINDENKHNSISLILEKYFSMQHLVSQRDSLLCRVYSKENVYDILPSNEVRETDV